MLSDSISKLAPDLVKVQAALSTAKKNSKNPHFRSTYADLESTWEACREPLTKHNFSVVQTMFTTADFKPGLRTILLHASGESISSEVLLPIVKPGPQDMGSCIKYMRRYCLAALVGVTDGEDDDAEQAEGRPAQKQTRPITNYADGLTPKTSTATITGTTGAYAPDAPVLPPVGNYSASKYRLSDAQVKRMYTIAHTSAWPAKYVALYVRSTYKKADADLTRQQYEEVCTYFGNCGFSKELGAELEKTGPAESIMDQFEKAKVAYRDHTQEPPQFNQHDDIPF